MRKIAIVGAGQAGLQLAHGLAQRGHDVTVISDRTPEEIFNGRVMGQNGLFGRALDYERELGLDYFDDKAAWTRGVTMDVLGGPGQRTPISFTSTFSPPGSAVDPRLKASRWAESFKEVGKFEVMSTSIEDLDRLAAENDLVCVAAGKGEISGLFERDDERSVFAEPQRQLCLVVVRGLKPATDLNPLHFVICGDDGELFWNPFLHKSEERLHGIIFDARAGSGMDRFRDVQDGDEAVEIAKQVIAEYAPWDSACVESIELADPLGWIRGAITPTVRHPVATLPSGRMVMGLGDTTILNDPVAGQGANCASKAAHFWMERIDGHGEAEYSADWVNEGFDAFWEEDGRWQTQLTNLFLSGTTPAAKEILAASTQSEAVARRFAAAFNEPRDLWPALDSEADARQFVAEAEANPLPAPANV